MGKFISLFAGVGGFDSHGTGMNALPKWNGIRMRREY